MSKQSRHAAPEWAGRDYQPENPIPSQDFLNKQTINESHGVYHHHHHHQNRTNSNGNNTMTTPKPVIFTATIILMCICSTIHIEPSRASQLCPKVCNCDNQEVICNGPFDATGLPHTLDPNTRRLTVNHAQTTQLSRSDLEYFGALEMLDLAFNKLSIIDFDHIKQNLNLNYLNLSHNSIVELKDSGVSAILDKLNSLANNPGLIETDEYKKLKKNKIHILELNVSHNQLTVLREFNLMRFDRLQKLDVSYNFIEHLENDSLFGLSKLDHLILRGNRLTTIPASAIHSTGRFLNYAGATEETISNLEVLDLSENPLISIEANSFRSLNHAREIYLDSCLISIVDPDAFGSLSKLVILSMSDNHLGDIPSDSFSALNNLRILRMNLNRVRVLHPYAFKHLHNLEDLQMANGTLREVEPRAFNGLASLSSLSLDHNSNLTKIDSSIFEDAPKLHHLDLRKCSLTTLSAKASINEHPPMMIDLRGNSLICNCDLKWLTRSMKKLNESIMSSQSLMFKNPLSDGPIRIPNVEPSLIDLMVNLTCAGPPALFGKQIVNLKDNKLECIRPTSRLNIHIGFASLLFLTLVLITVCLVNFCRNEKHLMGILKENIVQNRLSMLMPYSHDKHTYKDNYSKETQVECADYEPIDYGQDYGPIYTLPAEQYMNGTPIQQQTQHL